MDFTIGNNGNYQWLEVSSEDKTIYKLIKDFPHFVLEKHLAIICFDSGPFHLTNEQLERGWYYQNEIAYFDLINEKELEGPISEEYDQWLIFDSPTKVTDIEHFVNYSGFSLNSESMISKSISDSFWKMIKDSEPSKFILCGDFFIYGTLLKSEIDEMKRKWFSNYNQ